MGPRAHALHQGHSPDPATVCPSESTAQTQRLECKTGSNFMLFFPFEKQGWLPGPTAMLSFHTNCPVFRAWHRVWALLFRDPNHWCHHVAPLHSLQKKRPD